MYRFVFLCLPVVNPVVSQHSLVWEFSQHRVPETVCCGLAWEELLAGDSG